MKRLKSYTEKGHMLDILTHWIHYYHDRRAEAWQEVIASYDNQDPDIQIRLLANFRKYSDRLHASRIIMREYLSKVFNRGHLLT